MLSVTDTSHQVDYLLSLCSVVVYPDNVTPLLMMSHYLARSSYILPFSEVIDWSKAAVTVNERQLLQVG